MVHLSFGDTPATEYLDQLFADHLIHAWDVAQAIGADTELDADLVAACAAWFDSAEDAYRGAGAVGPRLYVTAGADPQTVLLARFGRSDTLAAVARFNDAFNRHDVDAVMALMTEDCVFDTTGPAPDGHRFEGQDEVQAEWERLFAASPTARFETEEIIAAGDRAVVRWTYQFGHGHVRGVDVLRVRDGRVAEKLSYVKG
jgi:ketosteroid isomerase-like protein